MMWIKKLLLILCLCSVCQAAQIIRYVDPDAPGPTHDGTSWNDAYLSLIAFDAGEATDLAGAGNYMTVYCRSSSGTQDTTQATIAGWTTSATSYIEIIGADFPADGIFDATKYVLALTNDNSLEIYEEFVIVRKLQIQATTTTGESDAIFINNIGATNHIIIDSCIIKGISAGSGHSMGIYGVDAQTIVDIYNCTIYGFKSGGDSGFAAIWFSGLTANIYNCTLYGNYYGVNRTAGAVTVKNCAVGNNTNDFNGTITMDYIVSDDDHSGDCANYHAFPTNGADDWSLDFTTPGSDFSLLATAANLLDDGLADVFNEDDDIIDTARPQGATWDIGAHEHVSVAPPAGGGQLIMIQEF